MNINDIAVIVRESLHTAVYVAMPILLICLFIGVVISVLQSITQIQENTLSFIPKILGVIFGLIIFMPYMYKKMLVFTDHIIQYMTNIS